MLAGVRVERLRWRGAAALIGLALCLGSWLLADPPGAAPDEAAHYIRAVSAAQGQWRGSAVPELTPSQNPEERLQRKTRRAFLLPHDLSIIPAGPCYAFKPAHGASCRPFVIRSPTTRTLTYVGVYPPFLYVPLGVGAEAASDPIDAMYGGRAAAAAISLILLMGAWSRLRGWGSRLAWFAALGPLTFFTATSLSTNGIEVAASVCFTAAALARRRGDRSVLTASWIGVAGVVLGLAKSLGPLFLVLDVLLVALWVPGGASPRSLLREVLRRHWGVAVAPITGAGIGIVWAALYVPTGGSALDVAHKVRGASRQLPGLVEGLFTNFGWLDTALAHNAWALGCIGWGALLLPVLIVGAPRQRAAVVLGVAGWIAVTVGFAAVEAVSGFGGQSRYTLAAAMGVLMVAGASLDDSAVLAASRLRRWLVLALSGGAMAVLGVDAWWTNARRYAVGTDGPRIFWTHAQWSPPLGWYAVGTGFGIGFALLVAATCVPRSSREPAGAPTCGPSDREHQLAEGLA